MGGNLGDGVAAKLLVLDYKGLAASLSECPRSRRKWVEILVMALWLSSYCSSSLQELATDLGYWPRTLEEVGLDLGYGIATGPGCGGNGWGSL